MSTDCCSDDDHCAGAPASPRYRRALWIALALNAAMAAIEISGGIDADSASMLADAADFLGDAANYVLSLGALVLAGMWRSRVAMLKGATMALIGTLALAVSAGVAAMLYAFRDSDANLRSVWLCSRNDAIGNLALLLAALGVFGTGTMWPDLLVAALMAALGLSGGVTVLRAARRELLYGA